MQTTDEMLEEKTRLVKCFITSIQKISLPGKTDDYLFSINPNVLISIKESENLYLNMLHENLSVDCRVDVVKKIIASNFDVRTKGCFGQTLLHFFCFDYECSKLLIEAGANVNDTDEFGDTALEILVNHLSRFRELYKDLQLVNLLTLYNQHGYNLENTNFGMTSLEQYLLDSDNLPDANYDETEFIYLLIQAVLPAHKHYKVLKSIISDGSWVRIFYYEKQMAALVTKKINTCEQVNNFFEFMHFVSGMTAEASWRCRLDLFSHILQYGRLPSDFDELPFSPLKGLNILARPQTILDCVKAIIPERFDINFKFGGTNLLHLLVEIEAYEAASWAIDQGIDLNIKTDYKRTVFELLLVKWPYSEQNIALCLQIINQPSFISTVSEIGQITYFRIFCSHRKNEVLNDCDRELLIKLAQKTYLNPEAALNNPDILKDQKLIETITNLAKYPMPISGEHKKYTYCTDAALELENGLSDQKIIANSKPVAKSLLQRFVTHGMNLNVDVHGNLASWEIAAYRLIGLITNTTSSEHHIICEDGTKFATDKGLTDFYQHYAAEIVRPWDFTCVVKKICEFKFNMETGGCYHQTLLHLVMPQMLPSCVRWVLEAGGDVNAQDVFGDTPLHTLIYVMRDANIWNIYDDYHDDFMKSIKLCKKYGADFKLKNEGEETPLELAISFMDGAPHVEDNDNIEKYLTFLALLAVYSVDDPINFFDRYTFFSNEHSILYQKVAEQQQITFTKDQEKKRLMEEEAEEQADLKKFKTEDSEDEEVISTLKSSNAEDEDKKLTTAQSKNKSEVANLKTENFHLQRAQKINETAAVLENAWLELENGLSRQRQVINTAANEIERNNAIADMLLTFLKSRRPDNTASTKVLPIKNEVEKKEENCTTTTTHML